MRRGRRKGSKFVKSVYVYIKRHDGQTILLKDIMDELGTTYPTVINCVRWLIDRDLIRRVGKKFSVIETS